MKRIKTFKESPLLKQLKYKGYIFGEWEESFVQFCSKQIESVRSDGGGGE
ncbi:hypothetical protein [Paenibacillus sp. FSL H3-0310]